MLRMRIARALSWPVCAEASACGEFMHGQQDIDTRWTSLHSMAIVIVVLVRMGGGGDASSGGDEHKVMNTR